MTLFAMIIGLLTAVVGLSVCSRNRVTGWLNGVEAKTLGLMVLAFLVVWLLVLGRGLAVPALLVVGVVVAALAFWVREFVYLMQQPDEWFHGRNDKLIWALLLIVLPPIGVMAFWSYRQAHAGPRSEKPEPVAGLRDFS